VQVLLVLPAGLHSQRPQRRQPVINAELRPVHPAIELDILPIALLAPVRTQLDHAPPPAPQQHEIARIGGERLRDRLHVERTARIRTLTYVVAQRIAGIGVAVTVLGVEGRAGGEAPRQREADVGDCAALPRRAYLDAVDPALELKKAAQRLAA